MPIQNSTVRQTPHLRNTQTVDQQSLSIPATALSRGVWTQTRSSGKGASGGESSEEAPPPKDKTPEPIIAEVPSPNLEDDPEEGTVSPWKENREGNIKELKTTLLTTVAGFDRGFAAIVSHFYLTLFLCNVVLVTFSF